MRNRDNVRRRRAWLLVAATLPFFLPGLPAPSSAVVASTDQACNITAIAAGGGNSLALNVDGTLLAWGDNTYGQLGNGTETGSTQPFGSFNPIPTQVLGPAGTGHLSGITSVANGGSHALAIDGSGNVWAWGSNFKGESGPGSSAQTVNIPIQVPGLNGVKAVGAGQHHSVALMSDGTVEAWGDNSLGQLSLPYPAQGSTTPVTVSGLPPIRTIAVSLDSNLALDTAGQLWAWGMNGFGQLGTGAPFGTARAQPAQVVVPTPIAFGIGDHSVAATSSGAIWTWGLDYSGELGVAPATLPGSRTNTPINPFGSPSGTTVGVGSSGDFSVVVESDGSVWAWGDNSTFELGVPGPNTAVPGRVPLTSSIASISTGSQFTLAVDGTGSMFAWGDNRYGQLGSSAAVQPSAVPCAFVPAIPPSVMQANVLPVKGLAGLPLAHYMGTFTDTDLSAQPSEYTAQLDWGDGQRSADTHNIYSAGPGVPITCPTTPLPTQCFGVYAQHVYASSGSPSITMSVRKINGQLVSASGVASITQPDPPSVHANRFGWDVNASVSPDEGLIVSDVILNEVKLGVRYMADKMSLPYLKVTTSALPTARRITLSPHSTEIAQDGSFVADVRLLSGPTVIYIPAFHAQVPGLSAPGIIALLARYRIDLNPSPTPTSGWLEVDQLYQFHGEFSDADPAYIACEPSQDAVVHSAPLNCARWKPVVIYLFHPGAGAQLTSINVAERLHFLPDRKVVQATTLAHDCDSQTVTPAGDTCQPVFANQIALYKGQNPIQNEVLANGVRNGKTGDYDNLHLTWQPTVSLPILPNVPPGCPLCIHIHWRWGLEASTIGTTLDPNFGLGNPLLDATRISPAPNRSSHQSLSVALVANHPGEESPSDVSNLVNPIEPLVDPVVWFSFNATTSVEGFFGFGGFFGSQ